MVVLFVGIGLSGYLAYKLFGQRSGAVLAGLLGRLISSTATAISCAPRSRHDRQSVPVVALMIVVASPAVFPRVLTEVAVVAPNMFWKAAPPLAIMLGGMVFMAVGVYLAWAKEGQFVSKGDPSNLQPATSGPLAPNEKGELAHANPAELLPALIFGGLYAVVLLGAAAAHEYFGPRGLYTIAVISGLHDLDAITLSSARFMEQGQIEPQPGWRLILAGSLSNLVLKGAAVAVLGNRSLFKWIALPYAAALLGGAAMLLFWP
jgi:uncharacterized membrane protein (DUF4010 family)